MQTDKDTSDLLRITNLRVYLAFEALRKHGTDDQAKRYAHGELPNEELLKLARKELFAPFDDVTGLDGKPLKRWAQGKDLTDLHELLAHLPDCPEANRFDSELDEDKVVFAERDGSGIPGHPHMRLFAARVDMVRLHPWMQRGLCLTAGVDPVKYETHVWTVKCRICKRALQKIVHKVSIKWAEHTLSREWVE